LSQIIIFFTADEIEKLLIETDVVGSFKWRLLYLLLSLWNRQIINCCTLLYINWRDYFYLFLLFVTL